MPPKARVAPRSAIEYIRSKAPELEQDLDKRYLDAYQQAFTIAGVASKDLLAQVQRSLLRALVAGTPVEVWRKQVRRQLIRSGWAREAKQFDVPSRLRLIYQTNLRSAYAAGHWAQIEKTRKVLPYLEYRLGPSRAHRDAHVKLDGMVLRSDDPFWKKGMPPNGYGCKCRVIQLSDAEAKRRGVKSKAPIGETTWRVTGDGKTRSVKVPEGIHPSFAYNPGMQSTKQTVNIISSKAKYRKQK